MLRKNNNPSDIAGLFAHDPERGADFSLLAHGWLLDYSRTPMERITRDALVDLPRKRQLREAVARLFEGAIVNPSEAQPALHMQLRSPEAPQNLTAERHRMLD